MCKAYYAVHVKDYLPQIRECGNIRSSSLLYCVNGSA